MAFKGCWNLKDDGLKAVSTEDEIDTKKDMQLSLLMIPRSLVFLEYTGTRTTES